MNRDKRNAIKKTVQTARAMLLQEGREILEGIYGLHKDGTFEDVASLPDLKDPGKHETRERLESFLREEAQAGLMGAWAVDKLVKEIAFTHLNRFVAFKMMEVRKIIRQTICRGVDSNAFKFYLVDHPEDERLYSTGRIDDAYERFLLWQSGELAKEIQVLFHPDNLPSRIFPRPRLLKELLSLLNDEEVAGVWIEDETIGWVYQYFIEEDKDRVFNKIYTQKQKMDLRDIPSATQIFTPKWIVQYLVENTLGRLWLRMHSDSDLMGKMKYYVPNANDRQTIPIKPVREITLLDPACGTMHFGMVAFDLFYEMYLEELERAGQDGWSKTPSVQEKSDIPASIIENNLYGIDLDLRAIQLSALSLYIKAKTKNGTMTLKRLNLTYTDIPAFPEETINAFVNSLDTTHAITKKLLRQVLPILNKAYYLGSLLKIEMVVQDFIEKERVALKDFRPRQGNLFVADKPEQLGLSLSTEKKIVWDEVKGEILASFQTFVRTHKEATGAFVANESMKGLNLIDALIRKHDVVVCNPPYSGRVNMNRVLRDDLRYLYPKKDVDLYSVFIDRCLNLTEEQYGFCGMVTIHSFMFTSSHEDIRREIINHTEIETMVHLGTRAEFDVANKTAQGFSMYALGKIPETQIVKISGVYFRLVNENEEEKHTAFCMAMRDYLDNRSNFTNQHIFIMAQDKLKAIPGWPFVYWMRDGIRNLFRKNPALNNDFLICRGLTTGDNNRFVRLWWEVGDKNIFGMCKSSTEQRFTNKIWVPYMKGGDYNRWYGNQHFVLNWRNDGKEISLIAPNSAIRNKDQYFKQGATYTYLTVSNFSLRLMPAGFIFADVSNGIIAKQKDDEYILLGIGNSKLITFLLKLINPTITTTVGDLSRLPFPNRNFILYENIKEKALICIKIKEKTLNTEETSWEFVLPNNWYYGLFCRLNCEKEISLLETEISGAVYKLYDVNQSDINQIEVEFGTLPGKLPRTEDLADHRLKVIESFYLEKHIPDEVVRKAEQIIEEEDAGESESNEETPNGRGRQRRFLTFEELCLASGFHPETVYAYITANKLERQEERYELAVAWVSYAVGIILGRFKPGEKGALGSGITEDGQVLLTADFAKLRTLADSDGIMVLDPGHPEDLTARIEEVLAVLLGEEAGKKIIHVLGGNLRPFLEKEFFAKWHIPQYRKRPVYWFLQTARKNYGLYLFHERLTADSLFLIQEKYLQPKIALEQNRLAELQGRLTAAAEGREKRALEKEIEKGENLIDELNEFLNKVKAVLGRGYDPDINDGVILNMAPLHELIPWAEPKKYWDEMQKGKYDWAHLAMKYRPEQVREKCRKDKSLAIAHDLV